MRGSVDSVVYRAATVRERILLRAARACRQITGSLAGDGSRTVVASVVFQSPRRKPAEITPLPGASPKLRTFFHLLILLWIYYEGTHEGSSRRFISERALSRGFEPRVYA